MKKLLTVEEVTEILQVHWQTVLKYVRTKKLKAVKLDRGYRIDPDDLKKFVEERKTI